MERINKDKILLEVLKVTYENQKIYDDIENNIRKLQSKNYSLEELDVLDEILKLEMEEDISNMSLIVSSVALIVSAISLIISCCFGVKESVDVLYVICMMVIATLVVIYVCYGLIKVNGASKRNAASIRMRVAIILYRATMKL